MIIFSFSYQSRCGTGPSSHAYIACIDLNSEVNVAIVFELIISVLHPSVIGPKAIATYPSQFKLLCTLHALHTYSTIGLQCVKKKLQPAIITLCIHTLSV